MSNLSGTSGETPNLNKRRMPIGAEVVTGGGVHFRVWAPEKDKVELIIESGFGTSDSHVSLSFEMENEGNGYFSMFLEAAAEGTLYKFRVDDSEDTCPDPASKYQPEGPKGYSQVVDSQQYNWHDESWKGIKIEGQIIYEMHIGTFTKEGSWLSAADQLPELASLGITCIELLPVADYVGKFGWGYDGVNIFAVCRHYGTPDEFRQFVDKAHKNGIGVILDVVYNHFGPEGNYLHIFSDYYTTEEKTTEWGAAINFDGKNSTSVREYYLTNARLWIEEYHLDGLRFDAAQSIFDDSEKHILTEIIEQIKKSAGNKSIITIAENESQKSFMMRSTLEGGYGIDALWNEDYHHSAIVAVTGRNEAYYTDHQGKPQEFISLAKYGFLFQGQLYKWQRFTRGEPALDIPPVKFLNYIQNHDQVANSPRGWRCHRFTSPSNYRALSAYLLLGPGTPMIFMGQEFAADTPFHYFTDMSEELNKIIWEGRKKFLSQFRNLATPEYKAIIVIPSDPELFYSSKLNFSDRAKNKDVYDLYKDLIRLRKGDPAFKMQKKGGYDGAVLGENTFILRFFCDEGDRLLIVNFGRELNLNPAPEPLLAPPAGMKWKTLWSSEDPKYGGSGTPPVFSDLKNVVILGHSAIVLYPVEMEK